MPFAWYEKVAGSRSPQLARWRSASAAPQVMFGIVRAVLLKPLPYHEPDRDSSIGSGSYPLKAEVFTLQKSGSFHFALTYQHQTIDSGGFTMIASVRCGGRNARSYS